MCTLMYILHYIILNFLNIILEVNILYAVLCYIRILPRLLQRSKESRGNYSTLYHVTSQWIMRSDTQISF